MKKITVFLLSFIFIYLLLGKNLNPFSKTMFQFHDQTQPARIQQFSLNLKNLKIPPRIAPDFYYKLGYPVFNFYAPTAYWITSGINLLGFDIVNSLKLSFLLAIILAFIFSFHFLHNFFDYYPSLFGAIIYITILYLPANIFVRGNLAEVWFITLLPLSLSFLYKNSQRLISSNLVFGTIILSLTYTSHNLLSIFFIPLSIIFAFLLKNKKINLLSIILALLLSSYFLLPLILENHLTIAKEMAAQTKYQDHFLCLNQLWDSPWGFGGSIKGCSDGMSFKLGKFPIIFAILGLMLFIFRLLRHSGTPDVTSGVARIVVNNNDSGQAGMTLGILFIMLTFFSLFMTTFLSQPIWDLFSPILAVFQFPWRLISFSMLGIAFFSSYFWHNVKLPNVILNLFQDLTRKQIPKQVRNDTKNLIIILAIFVLLIINTKYFQGKTISKPAYEKKYLSQKYIQEEAAFQIPEYFSNFPKNKEKSFNNIPIELINNQTTIEKISNLITLLTFLFLGFILINKQLWKKITN